MEIKNKQLSAVYNGNETIINEGFTMSSRYIVPLLARMKDEKILNESACVVIQTIFSFKHTEANPYPTNETIAQLLGRTVDSVKKALKSIRKAGVLAIMKVIDKKTGKEKRNSMYDFKPFFTVLEKFIIEFKNQNYDVSISELMEMKVTKSESKKDFPSIKPAQKKVVTQAPSETPQDAPQAIVSLPATTLPEAITNKLNALKIDSEGVQAVEVAYDKLGSELSTEMFLQKIGSSCLKKNFANYFTTCIENAYNSNEQLAPKSSGSRKTANSENTPGWLGKHSADRRNPNRNEIVVNPYTDMTLEELLKAEVGTNSLLLQMPSNTSLQENAKIIASCMKKFNKEEGVL